MQVLHFYFQHAFNWPIQFLDGRSCCILLVSVILLKMVPKRTIVFKYKCFSYFKFACKCSSKLCALVPREVMACDVSHASVINSILFLILFSIYPLHDVRRLEDPFNLAGGWQACLLPKDWQAMTHESKIIPIPWPSPLVWHSRPQCLQWNHQEHLRSQCEVDRFGTTTFLQG